MPSNELMKRSRRAKQAIVPGRLFTSMVAHPEITHE